MFENPFRALKQARNDFAAKADADVVKQKASRGLILLSSALIAGSQPAAAQGGELSQLTSLLNSFADLLQSIGLAMAVVGLSVAGIAYMAHKPRTAKEIAQNVVIGVVILLLSGAAIDYISGSL